MRDDLLDAKAAVDWAESDLPNLERRLAAWEKGNPFKIFRDVDSQPSKHLFRLRDIKPIPLIISGHAGAIIHSIRSSLDILAVSLAERNRHPTPEDVYFPISQSEIAFRAKNGGCEKIMGLAAKDIALIESLKPWNGGHQLLFELHTLDKIRKHRRLLRAYAAPNAIVVDPGLHSAGLKIVSVWPGFNEDAVIGQMPASTAQGNLSLSIEVRLAEPGRSSIKGLIAALHDFASTANLIIRLFDR